MARRIIGQLAGFFLICPRSYFGVLGWSKSDTSQNFMQISQIFIIFVQMFLKLMIFEKLIFLKISYF